MLNLDWRISAFLGKGHGDSHALKSLVATLKSGLEFLSEWDRRCQREVRSSRGRKVSQGTM